MCVYIYIIRVTVLLLFSIFIRDFCVYFVNRVKRRFKLPLGGKRRTKIKRNFNA